MVPSHVTEYTGNSAKALTSGKKCQTEKASVPWCWHLERSATTHMAVCVCGRVRKNGVGGGVDVWVIVKGRASMETLVRRLNHPSDMRSISLDKGYTLFKVEFSWFYVRLTHALKIPSGKLQTET
ncbi:hypothetical protein PoB_003368000 [Plakobranchus ocellatus]|uniref:Uncharacterized protein n=1 Tax=Plakobranchus ocellatus TaxID=259542 RepID=A0AAV4AIL2_9GAST|nr:hypothetical protein PoB_003368000 [Plakobranchus ocellatus]